MKKIIILNVVILFASNACSNPNSFIDNGSLESVQMDSTIINSLIQDIKADKIKNIHSIVIIKDDKLVLEEYFNGLDDKKLQYIASVTKSFASTLFGIAIDQGFFGDDIEGVLDKNVADAFPEYASLIQEDSLKNNLKIRHILSMSAGFDWDEHTHPYTDSRNDCNRINNNTDAMKFLFEHKIIHKPGTRFYYNGGLSLAISYLIEKYSKMSVDKFAEKYLFEPLDIKDYHWEKVRSGLVDTDGGLHLRAIDQAKLGYLFLNNGLWEGKQIVSRQWVETSTKMQVNNTSMPDYGLQWWGGDYFAQDREFPMYFASGHGGQKVIVIPEFDMVVVINQQVFNNPFNDLNFMAIVGNYILPAIVNKTINPTETTLSSEELSKYQGHYIGENDEFIDVTIENDGLLLKASGGDQNLFIHVSENIFEARILDLLTVQIKFNMVENGDLELHSRFGFFDKTFVRSN